MPNHVHLVLVPGDQATFVQAIGETHRHYTRYINFRENWKGYLWQGRFASFAMDESYLYSAVRYVELNPVKARLVSTPEQWRWSSARAHLRQKSDDLVTVNPMLERVGNWSAYLSETTDNEREESLRLHSRTGRPLGSDSFVEHLEDLCGRSLRPLKPGPKVRLL
jgi:putative transposase